MTKAFTMIELIFVIVILGILSAVALPKFQGVRNQADIANVKAQLSTIRAAIANDRQRRIIMGCNLYAKKGTGTFNCVNNAYAVGTDYNSINNGGLFGGVLTAPLTNSNTVGNWYTADATDDTYKYILSDGEITFKYYDSDAASNLRGTLDCNTSTSATAPCSTFD